MGCGRGNHQDLACDLAGRDAGDLLLARDLQPALLDLRRRTLVLRLRVTEVLGSSPQAHGPVTNKRD